MQLSKQLILFRYILKQFGYEAFEDLRDEFNNTDGGVSSTGYTFFAGALMAKSDKLVEDRLIQQYDEARLPKVQTPTLSHTAQEALSYQAQGFSESMESRA